MHKVLAIFVCFQSVSCDSLFELGLLQITTINKQKCICQKLLWT